ncbi:DUF4179 domain-containing protein [Halobacillus rhizosphaerae]|uniref:DUF4179 domain-containing protein n=1 Tax=Halobacillus rhizosphaerae TaxID=3064889 RepID=UPI00398BBAF7
MEKEWFDQQLKDIKVPKAEIENAIEEGMKLGRNEKRQNKKKSKLKLTGLLSSSAAAVVLASGLFFSPVTQVLAKIPLLNLIYEETVSPIGVELFKDQLVTELDKKASDNGVDVTITSAYYDGNVLGVTFKADGDGLNIKDMDKGQRPVSGFGYYLYDGSEQNQLAGGSSGLKKMDNIFIGSMEFYQPKLKLKDGFSLPLTFTSILGKKGTWKFDIPIHQISNENVQVNAPSSTTPDRKYSLTINAIHKGKATSEIDYITKKPLIGMEDELTFHIVDDQGNRVGSYLSGNLLSEQHKNGALVTHKKSLFSGEIKKGTNYLKIFPEIRKEEFDTIEPLKSSPFQVKSERFNYRIDVNKTYEKNNQLVVDYYIHHVDPEKYNNGLLMNFANQIKLIRSEDVIEEGDGQDQYEALKEDSLIYGRQGSMIDKEKMHFQSRFNIKDRQDFELKDYSLMVPFGIFSSNDEPIKMNPIKIELNNEN